MWRIEARLDILNERNETITCQFQLSKCLNQFEFFKIKTNETFVFCNFVIFKINSNLAVRERRLLQSLLLLLKKELK